MHFIYTLIFITPLLGATAYGSFADFMSLKPIEPEVVSAHLKKLTLSNKLGDSTYYTEGREIFGYDVQLDVNVKEIGLPVVCTGQIFASINSSVAKEEEEEEDYDYSLFDTFRDGFLVNLHNLKCGPENLLTYMSVVTDFTFVLQNKFPFLFVHHSIASNPIDQFLKYNAYVRQKVVDEKHPESYNTTVTIESSSEFFDLMNFSLDQTISNEDSITGYEIAKLFNPDLAVLVQSFWNGDEFFKQFSYLNVLNLTYSNILKEENIMLTLNLTKSLFGKDGFKKFVSESYRDEL